MRPGLGREKTYAFLGFLLHTQQSIVLGSKRRNFGVDFSWGPGCQLFGDFGRSRRIPFRASCTTGGPVERRIRVDDWNSIGKQLACVFDLVGHDGLFNSLHFLMVNVFRDGFHGVGYDPGCIASKRDLRFASGCRGLCLFLLMRLSPCVDRSAIICLPGADFSFRSVAVHEHRVQSARTDNTIIKAYKPCIFCRF
jgi:hypothetical protein